jgi:hypothetical protein
MTFRFSPHSRKRSGPSRDAIFSSNPKTGRSVKRNEAMKTAGTWRLIAAPGSRPYLSRNTCRVVRPVHTRQTEKKTDRNHIITPRKIVMKASKSNLFRVSSRSVTCIIPVVDLVSVAMCSRLPLLLSTVEPGCRFPISCAVSPVLFSYSMNRIVFGIDYGIFLL